MKTKPAIERMSFLWHFQKLTFVCLLLSFDLLGNEMFLNSSISQPEKKSRGKVAHPDGRILFHLLSFHLCRLRVRGSLRQQWLPIFFRSLHFLRSTATPKKGSDSVNAAILDILDLLPDL